MVNGAKKVRVSIIGECAKAEGLSEKRFLIKMIEAGANQKDIADKLRVSQSAVSQAFGRNGIRPVIKYEYESEVA